MPSAPRCEWGESRGEIHAFNSMPSLLPKCAPYMCGTPAFSSTCGEFWPPAPCTWPLTWSCSDHVMKL